MASNSRPQSGRKSLDSSSNATPHVSKSGSAYGRRLIQTSGSLEIVDGIDSKDGVMSPSNSRPPSNASERSWSRSSLGSVPPRSDSSLSKRTVTPTKQISLQAVRRKEESDKPFVEDVDWKTLNHDPLKAWTLEKEVFAVDDLVNNFNKVRVPSSHESETKLTNGHTPSEKELLKEEKEIDEKEKEDKDEDEDDSDDDDEEEEEEVVERKAPNELLMEFIDCIIHKDFKNAEKLCTMILLYEPANPEALKFKPLIQEKIKLDEEAANEEDDSDDDEEDDDDDDDDDDDNSDESSSEEESSEEDDDDDDDDGTTAAANTHTPGPSGSSGPTRDIFDLTAPSDNRWEYTLRDSKGSGKKS